MKSQLYINLNKLIVEDYKHIRLKRFPEFTFHVLILLRQGLRCQNISLQYMFGVLLCLASHSGKQYMFRTCLLGKVIIIEYRNKEK